MAGDLIRFPGRSRVTSEAHKEQADSGAKPAEHNGVSRLLRASIAAQLATLPDHIYIHERIDPDIGVSTLERVDQINLIDELLDLIVSTFTDQGGELRVSASTLYQPELLGARYRGLVAGHYALILFDVQSKQTLQPFQLTEALRNKVATAGGQLDASQETDTGLSVALHLPLLEAETSLSSTAQVLLVDDNEGAQSTIGTMLESLGYQVTVRAGALEALDVLRRNPDDFQLVLSDVTMPHLSGVELAARVKTLRAGLPVVLMSGFSMASSTDKALDVKSVLKKPFNLAELRRTLTLALKG